MLSLVSLLAFCLTSSLMPQPAVAGPRDAEWKKVQEAMDKGRPQTAIERLEPILEAAKEEKNYAEAIKALAKKIACEGQIQGHKAEEKITRLQADIPNWPAASHPILETVLAHWYWQFFQQNQWRFLQRTQTADPPGDDILTWDLARILAEIDKHFAAALAEPVTLQKIPIADYDDLLQTGNVPDSYRPTLYDFVAHEALRFYSSGTQAGAKPQDDFSFSADTPAFGTIDQFLSWKPKTTDTNSIQLKAIQLLQALLTFHKDDEKPDARIDADLARLIFAFNHAYGEDRETNYKTALEKFASDWADHALSARARAKWAGVMRGEGDLVKAHAIARQGLDAFPNTPGGNECYNLVKQIEAKQVSIHVERVWNEPWPQVQVQYKNVEKVYFRMVEYDWIQLTKGQRWSLEQLDRNALIALTRRKPAAEWQVDLPATPDYQLREESVDAPNDLKPGFYFILASHHENFRNENNNITSYAPMWVSRLALVTRTNSRHDEISGFVLDARTGEPLEGAVIKAWKRERQGNRTALKSTETNRDGLFRLPRPDDRRAVIALLASHRGHQVSTANDLYNYGHRQPDDPRMQTLFFTDRAIYRPGQTISYKGLCMRFDHGKDNYATVGGKSFTVIFRDPNNKEVARQTQTSNDYGSFHGSFTAPRDRLMGRMRITVEGDAPGNSYVSVEEYKRPRFKVTLDPPSEAARLNGPVRLTGKAESYTGASVDNANVTWRVVREVRYPVWWYWRCWWMPPQHGNSQEIAHGTTKTAVDGSFDIEFTALPDRSVLPSDEPTFRYTVYADVTDLTGETRSDQKGVNVGYTALKALMAADDWQTEEEKVEIKVSTQTLDGEGQSAKGVIKIYKLKSPEKVQRARLSGHHPHYPQWVRVNGVRQRPVPEPDPANPNSWERGSVVVERKFDTDDDGNQSMKVDLKSGFYRARLETQDHFGKKVTAQLPLQVLNPPAKKFPLKVPNRVAAPTWSVEPGDRFTALWGTGYDKGRAYVEIEHRNKPILAYWTGEDRTQAVIEQAVAENMRGGLILRVTQVRENRAYITQRKIDVPWSNKKLKIKWAHHTSKLEPGEKETWTATITGPDAEKAVAEVAAALYDESLDAYLPHRWMTAIHVFRQDQSFRNSVFQNYSTQFNRFLGRWPHHHRDPTARYRHFPPDILMHYYHRFGLRRKGRDMLSSRLAESSEAFFAEDRAGAKMPMAPAANRMMAKTEAGESKQQAARGKPPSAAPKPDLGQVSARKNLQETAFFFPQLITNDDGGVRLEFTMPEALTRWKFFAFAHDKQLRSGFLTDAAVTSRDIMVQPNPPRFLREADELAFTVKVVNLSPTRQSGTVRLTLSDARTTDNVDAALGNTELDQVFDIPARESRTFSWNLKVPDGQGFLIYKAVASTGKLSDGEEGYLPVLPRKILVTESLPLPIRDAKTKKFAFQKLLDAGKSDSLKHQSLTVQMVSNPSWYAVMALPYLMEYPHACSEQIFNRLYANALARHIAESDPKIRRVFDQWRGTDSLDSPLEKNQDLKAVMLEETPWLRQGTAENQARRNIGILFDENRLNTELLKAHRQLAQQQFHDGAWPWFPGGRANDYITLYITTGYARLRHLGVKQIDMQPAFKALNRLDNWIEKRYRYILRHGLKGHNNLNSLVALYLYCRSFFLEERPIAKQHREAVDFFLGEARDHWLSVSRQSQAHVALALQRFGVHKQVPKDIMISIREHAVTDEELGMFWRDTELNYWWYRAPIETQAIMIEAFDEVARDKQAVEDCKVWLLKQKQTQDWKTTKSTADAVYALLLRGTDLLASDELVDVSLGDMKIEPKKVEVGTGFYEQKFFRGEIEPELGEVTVTKTDDGVAWGSVHWQYFESMEKITPYEGTPLTLEKALYIKVNTRQGPELVPVKQGDSIKVGDELVVRVVLRSDRDMEYLHLKDQRGSGTEPIHVLSKYKYQDGLGYYESTRDTASHFFIDYLAQGDVRVRVFSASAASWQVPVRHGKRAVHVRSRIQQSFAEFSDGSGIVIHLFRGGLL